ncbi:hypothetical protein ACI2K4_13650 [Micromonospora sp. NPDC050397]|uniref:hypothetical protein n=1 Tax=Micromonospora sp. NPDC050397 TaxID=3364279 RepID=UPI00384B20FF
MTGVSPIAGRVRGAIGSATTMYLAALAMSGIAILLSVALPPGERGLLVATTTSATVGVAIGGLSLESFLLAQGPRWLHELAGRRSLLLYLGTVPLSAVLGWLFALYSAEASPGLSAVGAACIAASTLPAAAGLSQGQFLSVYRWRAVFATVAPALYLVLIFTGVDDADVWLLAWLGCQALMVVALWTSHGGPLNQMARRVSAEPERLARLGLTHTGAVAQIVPFRFDQLALARYQGPAELAIYSLAVAAIEFSQAGAVIAAQRTLGDHEEGAADRLRGWLRKAVLSAVGLGLLVLVGLAGIGLLTDDYTGALLLGALLLPRSVAVAVDKVLSARLVNLGGERSTAAVSIGTGLAAIVGYTLLAPEYGAAGIAALSGVLFAVHSTVIALALRKRIRLLATRASRPRTPTTTGVGEHA